jgi:hypothetical protein
MGIEPSFRTDRPQFLFDVSWLAFVGIEDSCAGDNPSYPHRHQSRGSKFYVAPVPPVEPSRRRRKNGDPVPTGIMSARKRTILLPGNDTGLSGKGRS